MGIPGRSPLSVLALLFSFHCCPGHHLELESYLHLLPHLLSTVFFASLVVSMGAYFNWRVTVAVTPWDFFLCYHIRRRSDLLLLKTAGIMCTNTLVEGLHNIFHYLGLRFVFSLK